MNVGEETRAIAQVVGRLAERFPDLPRASVERAVQEEHDALAGCRVRDFVPVLVERTARARLRDAQAVASGSVTAVQVPPVRR